MLRMHRVIAVFALTLAPLTAFAAPAGEQGHLTDLGSGLSLGLGVTPLRTELAPPASVAPPGLDLMQSTAISFDLKLTWPGSDVTRTLQPYLVVGPALLVVEPDYVSRLLGTRVDPDLRLGARAGAGLDWHLGKDLTLFGAWETTNAGKSLGTRSPADPTVSGHDFTYGLRLRY